MPRRKIKIAWIPNKSARKATLAKRRPSLLKKVSELAILCHVSAAVIVNSPDGQEVAMWPAQLQVVQQILSAFLDLPEIEQSKKMFNQETYLKDCVEKLEKKFIRVEKKLKALEIKNLVNQLDQDMEVSRFNLKEREVLSSFVKEKLREVWIRISKFPNTSEYLEQRLAAFADEGSMSLTRVAINHNMREIDLPTLHLGSSTPLAETGSQNDTIPPPSNNDEQGVEDRIDLGQLSEFSYGNDTGFLSDIFKNRPSK